MVTTVFVLPLAQGDVCRVGYTIESIRKHCHDYIIAIVLDGVQYSEELPQGDDVEYHSARYLSKGHWGAIWLNQMTAIKTYWQSDRTDSNTIYIKIDSDAVVVRDGLYQRASTLFHSRPTVGQLGQVYTDSVGNRLLNAGWQNFYTKTFGWRGLKMFLTGKLPSGISNLGWIERWRAWQKYREYIQGANEPHSYAIGGCYILRNECVEAIVGSGVIDSTTFLLTPDFGEDALMGLLVSATGFDKMDDVADDGLFAVGGLYNKYDDYFRANPVEIARRGHYIVHPFKFGYRDKDKSITEQELVHQLMNLKVDSQ